jgi:uncharacterized protein (TIGR02147 family)
MQLLEADSYRTYLSEELSRRMKSNPRYSQRAFARQLGMSPGELSEVLKGKRKLSLKSALRVARVMSLGPLETKHLLLLTQIEKSRELGEDSPLPLLDEPPLAPRRLSMDIYHIVSDWFCFAILNLADCEGFNEEPAWIARRLGISQHQAELALERLERAGLMKRENGKIVATPDYVISPTDIPSEAIRSSHRTLLEKARDALDFQSVHEREISGAGLAIDPRLLPEAKKEIQAFLDGIVAKYSASGAGRKSEVYQLEIAFFRLTEPGKGNT